MDEIQRLKLRRRRRQEAFQALDEVDDRIKALACTLGQVETLALELKTKRFLILTAPAPERAPLLALCDGAGPLLEDISTRVAALRTEFSTQQQVDNRERSELESLFTPKPTR